ncbi:unnamed protein product [Protopolystoma xenopodis]|uniref:Uncharacterized protein n=1 Tax=Protopolystoma xenopodis TaxID=117903 RepID=A0A3S5A6Q5_9PLAT|nr:unnamed protein product [Protopolystoma xenopodis]
MAYLSLYVVIDLDPQWPERACFALVVRTSSELDDRIYAYCLAASFVACLGTSSSGGTGSTGVQQTRLPEPVEAALSEVTSYRHNFLHVPLPQPTGSGLSRKTSAPTAQPAPHIEIQSQHQPIKRAPNSVPASAKNAYFNSTNNNTAYGGGGGFFSSITLALSGGGGNSLHQQQSQNQLPISLPSSSDTPAAQTTTNTSTISTNSAAALQACVSEAKRVFLGQLCHHVVQVSCLVSRPEELVIEMRSQDLLGFDLEPVFNAKSASLRAKK